MDRQTAQKQFIDGKVVGFIAEYLGSKGETIRYLDKKTGKAASFPSLKHTLIVNGEAVAFSEKVADDFDPEKFAVPYKRGDFVLAHITSFQNDKGVLRGSGTLEVLKN